MLAETNAAVPRLSPAEVRDRVGGGNVLIVDMRDAPELAAGGKFKGAVDVSRGMLEFRADPESPYHNPAFQKDKTVLVYCAAERQELEGFRLPVRLQRRRLQGTGRRRARLAPPCARRHQRGGGNTNMSKRSPIAGGLSGT
jgi:hypothetical protein